MTGYTALEQVKIRLKQFHIETIENEDNTTSDVVVFDDKENNTLIEQLIRQAKEDVISKRCYPSHYTEKQIDDDLKRYESVIVNLAAYDYSQAGENFMESYGENGISRKWKERDSLFVGVFPFANVL